MNRLSTVTDNPVGTRPGTGTTSYSYDAVGNLDSYIYPNEVKHGYTYNTLNRLTNVAITNAAAIALASFTYELEAAGNRTSITELDARQLNYSYDDLNRLTNETISNDPITTNDGSIGYQYDPVGNRQSRTSTIAVADMQPPTIVCPANVTAMPPTLGMPCAVVTYPAPTVADNCPWATFICAPASGSCFPMGTTTVTYTATDASGNMATCSFGVTTFDLCVQDDSNPGTVVLVNTTTGQYRFCCGGTVYNGVGSVTTKGNLVTVTDNAGTRRVLIKVDKGPKSGTASFASPPGVMLCQIRDTNITNNSCVCH